MYRDYLGCLGVRVHGWSDGTVPVVGSCYFSNAFQKRALLGVLGKVRLETLVPESVEVDTAF